MKFSILAITLFAAAGLAAPVADAEAAPVAEANPFAEAFADAEADAEAFADPEAEALADAEADADALAEADAEAEAIAEPTFLAHLLGIKSALFGIGASCSNCNVCETCGPNTHWNPVGGNSNIFITPGGWLTYGNSIHGSVAFSGTVINGYLYANSPFTGLGYGCVNLDGDGRLVVQKKFRGSHGWYVRNKGIFASSNQLYACPDKHGNHFLYCGGKHQHRKHISLRCN